MQGCHTIAPRRKQDRSAVTNGSKLLRGVDGRSPEARRFRDILESLRAEFKADLSEGDLALCRQAAGLTVKAEAIQATIVQGGDVDTSQLVRVTNALTRTLKELGLKTGSSRKRQNIRDYIREKGANA